MSPTRPATFRRSADAPGLGALHGLALLALALVAGLGAAGCENKAIGRTCDTLIEETDQSKAVFNTEALECPTRLCVKPAKEPTLAQTDTLAFCTAECSSDGDCDDFQGRNPDDERGLDKRCTSGFTCGVAFELGPLACKKMCLCMDFVEKNPPSPSSCPQ